MFFKKKTQYLYSFFQGLFEELMASCADCGSDSMKKRSGIYTCERCGLTLRPWELQKAQERADFEVASIRDTSQEGIHERKERERERYRKWIEGQKDFDD